MKNFGWVRPFKQDQETGRTQNGQFVFKTDRLLLPMLLFSFVEIVPANLAVN